MDKSFPEKSFVGRVKRNLIKTRIITALYLGTNARNFKEIRDRFEQGYFGLVLKSLWKAVYRCFKNILWFFPITPANLPNSQLHK